MEAMDISSGERAITSMKGTFDDSNLPWVEKYRPTELDQMIAHEDIISILDKLIKSKKLPHLLFYGPPGTGKTSAIMACARKLYGNNYRSMMLELNASDDRGIDVVREQIKEFASTRRLFNSGVKLIILDEADAMTNDAQFALRRIIEQFTRFTRFCIICNFVNKINPALQSRCTKFRFAPLKPTQIRDRLSVVIEAEKVDITDDGFEAILRLSEGDMRRVLNLLQSTHMAHGRITEESAYFTSGAPFPQDIDLILDKLLHSDFKDTFSTLKSMSIEKGYAAADIVCEITQQILHLKLPSPLLIRLMTALSDIEYRLSNGSIESLELGALVSVFTVARHMIEN